MRIPAITIIPLGLPTPAATPTFHGLVAPRPLSDCPPAEDPDDPVGDGGRNRDNPDSSYDGPSRGGDDGGYTGPDGDGYSGI